MSTTDADQISTFLKECNLLEFKEKLKEEGVTRVKDIEDLTEETLKKLGLTSTQAARLKRKFAALPKAVSANSGEASASNSLYRAAVVHGKTNVLLPKGFFNKDGGKVLRVDSTSLQKRYKDLWYTFPCNIKQNLSNSFILTMCQMMEPKFKTLHELSDWARKEREKRIELLFAVHPVDENLGKESKFIQSKSLKWQLHQLKKRYPVSAKVDMFLKMKQYYPMLMQNL